MGNLSQALVWLVTSTQICFTHRMTIITASPLQKTIDAVPKTIHVELELLMSLTRTKILPKKNLFNRNF